MSNAESSRRKIPFTCPHCSHYTEVDAKFGGQTGPCVSCSNPVTVPTLESISTATTTTATPESKPIWIQAGMVVGGLICAGVLGIVVWSLVEPAFRAARDAAKCSACEQNMLVIAAALEDYYQENGEYPPAVQYGDNGKAKHSWRVLILPYLGPEGKRVADMYDMEEPWDSKKNMVLVRDMPTVFRCPSDGKAIQGETSYLAVVGPRTLINRDTPVKRRGSDGPLLTDNASETMVIIEAAGSAVNWMEPKDIPVAALRAGLNSSNPASPGSEHQQGVNVLMADQSVIRFPDTIAADDLQAMSTIDGGNEYIEALDELAY